MDMFKASYKTDFSALNYNKLMKLVLFLEPFFVVAKCTWSKCKGLFIQKYYI